MPRGVYVRSPEYRAKMSIAMKTSGRRYNFECGHTPWNKGLTAEDSPKVAAICAKGLLRYAQSAAGRQKSRQHLTKLSSKFWANASEEEKQAFIERRAIRIREMRGLPEACAKQRASMRRTHAEHPEWAEKTSRLTKQRWQDPEYRQRILEALQRGRDAGWADPEKREKRIRATWEGSHRRPTGTEQIIIDVITEYGLPYKYVGCGDFLLEGKNPDFVNVNGEKKIIEVFGEFWHDKNDEQERKDFFAKYGFKTLVLWHKDIVKASHEAITQRIKEFV